MHIIISNQSELPIYAQIREQIKEQILSGRISEGTTLPSIRKLAQETGVSVITTTRAYNELEQEGFIASMQGKGSVVLPRDNQQLQDNYTQLLTEQLETAVATAKLIHHSEESLTQLLHTLWNRS